MVMPDAAVAMNRSYHQIAVDLSQQPQENAPRLGLDAEFVVRDGSPYTEPGKRPVASQRRRHAGISGRVLDEQVAKCDGCLEKELTVAAVRAQGVAGLDSPDRRAVAVRLGCEFLALLCRQRIGDRRRG